MSTVRTLIEDLANIQKIKTWSLIVTMFGDLDECHPQSLSGKEIGAILEVSESRVSQIISETAGKLRALMS